MSFVERLRAVAEPLYRDCECGSETIRWGATEPLVRVNAMRPLAVRSAMLRLLDEYENAIPATSLNRLYRKVQRKIQRGFGGMMSEWDDFMESAMTNISLA